MSTYDYDVLVIGSSLAGLTAAQYARSLGASVAIIESQHQSSVSSELIQQGIDVLQGNPVFLDAHHVMLHHTPTSHHKKITFGQCIIATGSSPKIPVIEGIDSVAYLTSQTAFDMLVLPKSMIILGGTAVGVELACIFNYLGVHVTIVEKDSIILPDEDQELARTLVARMQDEGIIIKTDMSVTRIMPDEHGIKIEATDIAGKSHEYKAEKLLVAVGKKPNVYHLGLENAGIHFDSTGIKVDADLRTSMCNVFACGDVVGAYDLSNRAWYQAYIETRHVRAQVWQAKICCFSKK